jgi:hypothetical protein
MSSWLNNVVLGWDDHFSIWPLKFWHLIIKSLFLIFF